MSSNEHNIPDEWQTGSGLALDGAQVIITKAQFGFNANLGPDVPVLNLTLTPAEGGEDIEQSFSVGKGWEFKEKGELLVPANGKNRPVNYQTGLGRLIDSAVEAIKASGQDFPFASPKVASAWVGTEWTFKSNEHTVVNPVTKVEQQSLFWTVTDYHGKGIGKSTPAKGATKGQKAAEPENTELLDQLFALARESADHESFMDAALEIPGVENSPLEKRVIKAKGDGSIWGEVQAEG